MTEDQKKALAPIEPLSTPTKEEIEAIFSLPAVYINHFYASPISGNIMICLAQRHKDKENDLRFPRYNITLSLQAAAELNTLLSNIIRSVTQPQQKNQEREKLN